MVATFPLDTPASELRDRLHHAIRAKRQTEHDIAVLMHALTQNQRYRDLGYISISEYAEQEHGFSGSKARALVRLAEAMVAHPSIADALQTGELSWTKAREVGRIATEDTVADWLSNARTVTNRELETLRRLALPGDSFADAQERHRQHGGLRSFSVRNLSQDQADLLERALVLLQVESGLSADDFCRADALVTMAQRIVYESKGENAPTGARFQRVIHVCERCGQAEGELGPADDTDVHMANCCGDTVVIDTTLPQGAQEESTEHGRNQQAVRPRVQRAVRHRDRNRCVIPGCRCRIWVEAHHIVPRSLGGGNDEANLASLCTAHHRLLHDGRMALEYDNDGLVATFADGRVVRFHLG